MSVQRIVLVLLKVSSGSCICDKTDYHGSIFFSCIPQLDDLPENSPISIVQTPIPITTSVPKRAKSQKKKALAAALATAQEYSEISMEQRKLQVCYSFKNILKTYTLERSGFQHSTRWWWAVNVEIPPVECQAKSSFTLVSHAPISLRAGCRWCFFIWPRGLTKLYESVIF